MARPFRLEFEGALYHIPSRGDRQEAFYEIPNDRERSLEILGASARNITGLSYSRISRIARECKGKT